MADYQLTDDDKSRLPWLRAMIAAAVLGVGVGGAVIVAPIVTAPASEVVFDEAIRNGWSHFDDYAIVAGVGRDGSAALQQSATAWSTLNLYKPGISPSQTITLWVKADRAIANLYIREADNALLKLPSPSTTTFTRYDVKLSSLTSKTTFSNVVLQSDTTATITVDDVSVTAASSTPVVAAPVDAGTAVVVPSAPAPSRWVSGYYVGYERGLQPISAIDFTTMTHLIVGRVVPNVDGTLDTDFDISAAEGPVFARAASTAARAAGKKAILMVGGSGTEAGFVGAASSTNRARFVAALLIAMDDYGYDGLDLDWEPIGKVHEPTFLELARALRIARPSLILTVPVSWAPQNEALFGANAALFDQISIMSYGMADQWGSWTVWHSSALKGERPSSPTSVSKAVDMYLAAGVPASRLGVGIGAYGSCWSGTGTVPGAATTGSVTGSDGAFSYAAIKARYPAAPVQYDAAAEAPYLSAVAGCSFLSYEDARSIAAKGAYAKAKGLGGAIVWTISQGYQPTAAVKNPIMTATKTAFLP